jgi:hypothetical protein
MVGQEAVNAVSLHTPSASVNQSNFSETLFDGGFQVALHDVGDLARPEEVKVD